MNTHATPIHRSFLFLFLAMIAVICVCDRTHADEASTDKFRWVDTSGKFMELLHGDRPVLRYMYRGLDDSSPQARYETYKVFHHLYDPSGKLLLTNGPTGDAPFSKDVLYQHHRGIFYGFTRITYGDGKQANLWGCGGGESQRHVKLLDSGADSSRGWHRVAIDWCGRDGEVFAKEERQLTVHAATGGTLVEFESTLTSATGGTVHLDGDPQHAGFQFRAADEVAKKTKDKTYYLRTDGKGEQGKTRNWSEKNSNSPIGEECTNRPWNAMSFVLGGKRYTALYVDHPDNPKPGRYSERDYGRFGSYFVFDLTPDKPLVVRYRIWLQEGEMTVSGCKRIVADFGGG